MAARRGGAKVRRARSGRQRTAARTLPQVPDHHWDLPMTFRSDGSRTATLSEYVDSSVPTLTLAQLTPAQRTEIVLARLARRRDYPLVLVNGGHIDKARAVTEVQHQTAVGAILAELELRMMKRLVEHAAPVRRRRPFSRSRSR